MKIYAIQWIYEDGYEYWRYYHDEDQRNFDFEESKMIEKDKKVLNIGNKATVRKRDYKEIREDQSKKTAEDILKFAEEFFEYDEEGFIEELKKFIDKTENS